MSVELAPHQLEAISQMHHGCIVKGGVGVGKTRTALAYYVTGVCEGQLPINGSGEYQPMKKPRDLYVITTARKRESLDWQKEASDFAISTDAKISRDGVRIIVDSWNNVQNYVDCKDACFIFDEQRLVGSGAWVKAFYKIAKANFWFMLSATPGDNWMDYGPVFVANGYYKNITDFKTQHIVYSNYTKFPKIERWLGQRKLEHLRARTIVDMPYERHTKRHIRQRIVEFNRELFNDVMRNRWNVYKEKPIESLAEYYYVLRKVCNSDPSRTQAIREILDDHPGLIVFYNFDYELALLRDLADEIDIPSAEWNGHRHEEVPEGKYWMYLVQYTAGAEAWNCVRTDAVAFWSLNYSYKINEQARGRIDRLNTPYTDLYYYQIRSTSPIDLEIMKSLQSKKTFNEKSSRVGKQYLGFENDE